MTREEQLRFCKICTKQKFDLQQGLICSLTSKKADFEDTCDWFEEDTSITENSYLSEFDSSKRLYDASRPKRFANYVIDLIGYIAFSALFGVVLGILIGVVYPKGLEIFEIENKLFEYLFGAVVGMIYYGVQEHYTGRTIAKYLTKTKVVMQDGSKPSFKTIIIRSLCRFIPFEALTFLFGDNTGLHDKISKTRVVDL